MARTALILGITGSLGSAVARSLLVHGWNLRALHRDPAKAACGFAHPGTEWVQGDAMVGDDLRRAAIGTDIILYAVNPPGYRNWRGLAIPMLANTIEAAKTSDARIFFPGNVYNYGADAWPLVNETSPQQPRTRKGAVRVEMEAMLKAATEAGSVRAVVLRAGDFFGAQGAGAWFENVMVKRGKPVKAITYPGDPNAGHAWAYLPDLAETFGRLAECEAKLESFETFHFGGHYLPQGIEMAAAIRRAAGLPSAPIRKLPWAALHAAALVNATCRELLEMRYLWQQSVQLDNRKLLALLGIEPHTPLDQAVACSLAAIGCVPGAEPSVAF